MIPFFVLHFITCAPGEGGISHAEFITAMRRWGLREPAQHLKWVAEAIDTAGEGRIKCACLMIHSLSIHFKAMAIHAIRTKSGAPIVAECFINEHSCAPQVSLISILFIYLFIYYYYFTAASKDENFSKAMVGIEMEDIIIIILLLLLFYCGFQV